MLAEELYALFQGQDYGMSIKMMFKSVKWDAPLYTFTDPKSFFDTVAGLKRLRQRRLMNDTADIRHAYCVDETTNITWILST